MEKVIEKDGYPWVNLVDLNDKLGVWTKYKASRERRKQILVDDNGKTIHIQHDVVNPRSYSPKLRSVTLFFPFFVKYN